MFRALLRIGTCVSMSDDDSESFCSSGCSSEYSSSEDCDSVHAASIDSDSGESIDSDCKPVVRRKPVKRNVSPPSTVTTASPEPSEILQPVKREFVPRYMPDSPSATHKKRRFVKGVHAAADRTIHTGTMGGFAGQAELDRGYLRVREFVSMPTGKLTSAVNLANDTLRLPCIGTLIEQTRRICDVLAQGVELDIL